MLKFRALFLSIIFFGFYLNGIGQPDKILHASPVANFAVQDLCWGSTTLFKNLSAAATNYTWTFYETNVSGNAWVEMFNSSDIDISYKFTHKGNYKVYLWAYNGHLDSVSRVITVDTITRAEFVYQTCQGRFINLSSCSSIFLWDFGDSLHTKSTEHSPAYFYPRENYYTAALQIREGPVIDTVSKTTWCLPNHLYGSFTFVSKNDTVFFNAKDSLGLLDYYWTWGDGTKTLITGPTGKRVSHKYSKKQDDAVYYVYLLVRNACNNAYSMATFSVTGLNEVFGTSIYPNPPEFGLVHIVTDRKAELSSVVIINSFGTRMNEFVVLDASKGIDLDLSLLPKGIYSLTLNFSNGDKINKKIATGG
jgi:hypothetical protein